MKPRELTSMLTRSLLVRASQLADLPGVPVAAECGIRVEARIRRAVDGVQRRLCRMGGVPSASELSALRERVSLIRYRLDALNATAGGPTQRRKKQ